MSNPIWSKRTAPCTIFSTTTLSPRQIANKAYTLGCKKLDRDDKRSHQKYHLRERLLLYDIIAKAEEVLSSRTKRTNRRVMAAEDEEESDEFSMKHNKNHSQPHHSPLREEQQEEDIPLLTPSSSSSTITSNTNSITSPLLHPDCKLVNETIQII